MLFGDRVVERMPRTCLHLHWGLGARILGPVDGGGFVDERRHAAAELRKKVLDHCTRPRRRRRKKTPFIERSCTEKAARCLAATSFERLRRAFAMEDIALEPCCDWERPCDVVQSFAEATIVVGMHGAGLANAIFAPEHFVLVELHTGYGSNLDLYRKLAQARKGGYVSVSLEPGGILTNASQLAQCALRLSWTLRRSH